MPDLSNAEISVEGEYGECLVCGESFHWEQLTNTAAGSYCDDHAPRATDWRTRPQPDSPYSEVGQVRADEHTRLLIQNARTAGDWERVRKLQGRIA